ncbi:hypothetical protein AAE478_008587 [Parahypoxylon ruwenzoriense]
MATNFSLHNIKVPIGTHSMYLSYPHVQPREGLKHRLALGVITLDPLLNPLMNPLMNPLPGSTFCPPKLLGLWEQRTVPPWRLGKLLTQDPEIRS